TIPPVTPTAPPPTSGTPTPIVLPKASPIAPVVQRSPQPNRTPPIATPKIPGQLPAGIPLPDAPPTGGLVRQPGLTAPQSAPVASVPMRTPMAQPVAQAAAPAIAQPVVSNQPMVVAAAASPAPMPAEPVKAIDFGQPLPGKAQTVAQAPIAAPVSSPGVNSQPSGNALVLPAGTTLSLRYTGISGVNFKGGEDRQELLELQTPIQDTSGRLLIPMGSTVLGRFESKMSASRFITQSISLQGRSWAIVGQSGDLGGTKQPSERNLLQNSGIGALAGAIVGGLSGGNVLGGAAAGAAITYVTAPKATTIQPGQVLEVQLTEDFVIPML
ncbi:MAG: hypothetical protein VKJ24_10390, partial [Synechococcales bacterium]|nr:hypothetical protein [Synechococcales bacterium]